MIDSSPPSCDPKEVSDRLVESFTDVSNVDISRSLYPKYWNLISCGRNRGLNLWNWKTGDQIGEVEDAHDGMILTIIEYKKDCYASGGCDMKINLWRGYDGGLDYEGELNGHSMDVNCICNLEGRTLISGSDDHDLRVWDTEEFECVSVLRDHFADIRDVKAIDNRCVASASYDKTVRIFDIAKEMQKSVLRGHISRVRCLEYTRDWETLFSGSYGRRVIVWDLNAGKKVQEIKENNWINSIHFFQAKRWLVTGDDQGKLGWWDVRKMSKALRYDQVHENFVTSIVTIMKGLIDEEVNQIATCSTDGKICIVDVEKGEVLRSMEEKGWVFGLLNHERSFPDHLLMLNDTMVRNNYLHKKIGDFEIKIPRGDREGKFTTIKINRMLLFLFLQESDMF